MTDEVLITKALEMRGNSYSPYSNFAVSAALLTESGKVFTGVNVENASYGLTICAERVAIATAVAAGEKEFQTIAVVVKGGGSPCGACRQVLNESESPDGGRRWEVGEDEHAGRASAGSLWASIALSNAEESFGDG
jgi:cytidine deaminase